MSVRPGLRIAFLLLLGALPGAAPASGPDAERDDAVARVDQRPIHCDVAHALERCAAAFLARMRSDAERAYIDAHGLHASDAEIESVHAYERAFRLHDRAQRARKLVELDERLGAAGLSADERSRLERFRDVLARLARYDADVDAGLEKPDDLPREAAIAWVLQAKLDAHLQDRIGGVIGVRASGPYAHGARIQVLRQFLSRQRVEWLSGEFADAVERLLAAPPAIVHHGQVADFTPFWQRPIPPSYMRD
jgi:hypothetical protein